MSEKTKGILYMVVCAAMWSIGGLFIKLVPWNPVAIAGARSLVAGCVVLAYLLIMGYRLHFNRHTVAVAVSLLGIYLPFVAATKLTTAANAIVIQYTGPLYLLLFNAVFRKQRFRAADWAVVLLTVLGVGVFFLDQLSGGSALGNAIALFSGVSFAAMFITTGDANEEDRIGGIFLGQILTALVGLPVLFFTRAPITLQSVGCILALGVLQLGLSYVLYAKAMCTCPPLACSVLAAIEPLLNPVWVFLFTGERPGLLSLIGGAIVIVSVTAWCVYNARVPAPSEPRPGGSAA